MLKKRYSKEEKLYILNIYQNGEHTLNEVADRFSVNRRTILDWQQLYSDLGEAGLEPRKKWASYTAELKRAAVNDYLSGNYSLREVALKYHLSNKSILQGWIQKYTSHSELKDSGKGMSQTMTKGRKTTVEERIEIVDYCLKHQNNYQLAAETFAVSYQQVYQWVKKFEANGEAGLADRRGRTKDEIELTAEEKLKLEIKRIERENERLRAENLFLKKLEEIERRR